MTLYCRESGPRGAPTILFLHGGGVSGWQWEPQVKALTDFHCLVPDLPGHGRSRDEKLVSFDNCVAHLAELIRVKAHGGKAHLVGNSFGGQLVAWFLATTPELVEHAVMTGALARSLPGYKLINLATRLLLPLGKRRWAMETSRRQLRIPDEFAEDLRRDLASATVQATVDLMTLCGHFEVLPRLAGVTVPTLVLVGEKEKGLSLQSARAYAAIIPAARGYVVPGVGHVWNLEEPDLFTGTVRAWVTDRPLPAALRPLQARP